MRIFYPSAEHTLPTATVYRPDVLSEEIRQGQTQARRRARQARHSRHYAIREFLVGKGLEVVGRPPQRVTRSLGWLATVDGMVVERSVVTRQIERECTRALAIGKPVLLLVDKSPLHQAWRREPSTALTRQAYVPTLESDSRLHVVHLSGEDKRAIVAERAIDLFLEDEFGFRNGQIPASAQVPRTPTDLPPANPA